MPILYGLIARKKAVLAEYTTSSGNFPTVTRVLLAKIPEVDSKMSYVYDKYVFHYLVDQGITFLCMSDENLKTRIPFSFLEDIKKQWRERYSTVEQTALAFSLNDSFSPIIKKRIVSY
jgi:vesicle-associated membrane protein 7